MKTKFFIITLIITAVFHACNEVKIKNNSVLTNVLNENTPKLLRDHLDFTLNYLKHTPWEHGSRDPLIAQTKGIIAQLPNKEEEKQEITNPTDLRDSITDLRNKIESNLTHSWMFPFLLIYQVSYLNF